MDGYAEDANGPASPSNGASATGDDGGELNGRTWRRVNGQWHGEDTTYWSWSCDQDYTNRRDNARSLRLIT